MKSNAKRYDWKPDLPDHRDHLFAMASPSITRVPDKVDLSPYLTPVEDQGDLGACTAHALAGALEYLENKDYHPPIIDHVKISRLFVYYNERFIEGSMLEDSGAEIRDGIKSLVKYGAANEALWPYDVTRFRESPGIGAYEDAGTRRIKRYLRIDDHNSRVECLAHGYPFVFGFSVFEAFEGEEVAKSGKLNLPKKTEAMMGGHAVLCVGYNMKTRRYLVRNSWGTSWGKDGYFTMPFEYLDDPNLADDMWMITKGTKL